jgi:beta-N-acetylhexosaminidase
MIKICLLVVSTQIRYYNTKQGNSNSMDHIGGTHFITGLETTHLLEHEKKLLSRIQPLGLIFFARNFESPKDSPEWKENFHSLVKEAQEASNGSIRICSIDYEGGRVHRFPDTVTRYPYAREWASSASRVAEEMSQILASFKLNMTYSPVLDVDLEPQNPVIGPRAFSSDPGKVIDAAVAFYQTTDANGILTCGKHFPGHGRTNLDSHLSLPVLNITREELETDLLPFRALIQQGIPCLMSAHIIYPKIDPKYPASLSISILDTLLRKDLAFSGLLFTDDLDMRALAHFSGSEKVTLALEASSDLIVVGNGIDGKSLETISHIQDETRIMDSSLKKKLERSKERIHNILKKYAL